MNCPCQSNKEYADCCERFITQQSLPENAEQLMRSRYTAYVFGQRDYLMESWHPAYRPECLQLDDDIRWLGLTILHAPQAVSGKAEVEFEARLLESQTVQGLHERSQFVMEQGRWLYTQGEMLKPGFQPWKPGRNESCPCGSGQKFKRCCAA